MNASFLFCFVVFLWLKRINASSTTKRFAFETYITLPLIEKLGQGQIYQIMDFNKLSICIYTYTFTCVEQHVVVNFFINLFWVDAWFSGGFSQLLSVQQATDSYKYALL